MRLTDVSRFRVRYAAAPAGRVVSSRHLRSSSRLSCLPGSASLRQRHAAAATTSSNAAHHTSSSSSSARLPRGRVVAAASGAAGSSGPAPSLDALSKMKLTELKDRCRALGLQVTGNKAELVQRIWDAQQQQQQGAGPSPPAPAAAASAGAAGDVDRAELLAELVVEIGQYSPDALLACLADRGLDQAGSREQLVERLAQAVADETLESGFGDDTAAAVQPPSQQQPAAAAAAAAPPPEREWLIADKQQVLLDELLAMGVLRQELVDILKDMGQDAAEEETLEELAERASWLLAEEEVLLMEQQAAGGAAGDAADAAAAAGEAEGGAGASGEQGGLADHPSSVLDGFTATDINKMKVDDLRKYLRALGLSDEGSRYVLRDRLVTMLVVRKAATAGDTDYLLTQLASMTLSELRGELERRGLDLSGTKASLELRLAQALVVEVAGPAAANMLGQDKGADEAEAGEPEAPLMEDYDETLTAVLDPAFRAALICGTTHHTSSSSSSSSSASQVAQALATAVALVDELHTAPLDPQQAADMQARAAAAAAADASAPAAEPSSTPSSSSSSSKSKGRASRGRTKKTDSADASPAATAEAAAAAAAAGPRPDPSRAPAAGITVDVYWGDSSGTFYQLPRTRLAATAPSDLAAALPALATARFDSLQDLAQHMQQEGTGAALSLLPGGALACGGQLAAACAAAGVPLAFQGLVDSSSSSSSIKGSKSSSSSSKGGKGGRRSTQQEEEGGPVLGGRAAVLSQLQGKGYLTLPVLQVSRDEVRAAAGELSAWLDAVLQGLEADEGEEAEGQDPSSSSSSSTAERQRPVSPILKAWTAARYETAAAADDAAAEGAEGEGEGVAAPPPLPAFAQSFASWCSSEGLDPDGQLLSVSDAAGGELRAAVRGGARLLQHLLEATAQESCPPLLLVEPLHRQLSRWEVVVTLSPEDGPVALLPVEVEGGSVKEDLTDAALALQEWRMMQAGVEPEELAAQLELLSRDEPDCIDALTLPDSPDPLPYHTLKLHSPPRASTKLIHTMRHAAAKAVSDLGLGAAGLVRVRGWFAATPDWQAPHTAKPEDLRNMPDSDPRHLGRMREEELARRASEPLPLSDYYDEVLLLPDLAAFDPAARCRAEANGDGDVLLADVALEVPLHTTSLAGIQAAEVGLGPGGLARHLLNMALFAAGQEPLLPPPPVPELSTGAQWAQWTGANDSLGEIAVQLADANEELREALETAQETVEDAVQQAAFARLSVEEGVVDIVDGLSFTGGTLEALAAPTQEPEEWTPEFDERPLSEITAERDAGRTPEDLAARQMRDEALPVYGDQPIHYDRYDDAAALQWEPPFAAAAAAGQPVPSIEQLRQEVADKLAARQAELEAVDQGTDALSAASEDEVMVTRLLEGAFYEGGVSEAIKRRAEQAQETAGGGGAATMAAAALSANVAAAEAAGEAAAAVGDDGSGSGSSSGGGVSWRAAADRWPWPTAEEVLEEAAERRAAQRVWVLMGGDGPARQQALRSGANIWAKLQRCCDLQVDAFVLPPSGAGLDESRRRAALLARRTEWQALGIPEEEYPHSMRDDQLLSMPANDVPAVQRTVLVAGPSQLARHTVEEALESAERLAQRAGAAPYSARVQEAQQLQAVRDTQMELDAHFVAGVGAAWGGKPELPPPAPRFMDVEEFVSEAAACGATLILALHDTLTATGELQQLLEGAGVGYTGVSADYALSSANRMALNKHVTEIADSITEAAAAAAAASGQGDEGDSSPDEAVGLIPLPLKVIKTDKLLGCLRTPEDFEGLWEELMLGWEASDSLVLRPPADSAGLGVARLSTPQDLATYAAAIAEVQPRLPPGSLSQQPGPVTLPLEPPALLVAEPWVDTAAVGVGVGPGGGLEVTWAADSSSSSSSSSSSRWLEVSIGLLGELGSMEALPLTLVARNADGSRQHVTPPPDHILPASSVEAAQGCALALAVGLGLRSIAQVDGFVHADTGELIVRDVKAMPALTDGSPLLQQVLQRDPPLLPHQLFRQLARDAWVTNRDAQAAAAAGAGSISSAYYSSAEGGALGASDFELEGMGGDIFAGAGGNGFGAGGGGDDEEGAGGVEDDDMQAAGYTA